VSRRSEVVAGRPARGREHMASTVARSISGERISSGEARCAFAQLRGCAGPRTGESRAQRDTEWRPSFGSAINPERRRIRRGPNVKRTEALATRHQLRRTAEHFEDLERARMKDERLRVRRARCAPLTIRTDSPCRGHHTQLEAGRAGANDWQVCVFSDFSKTSSTTETSTTTHRPRRTMPRARRKSVEAAMELTSCLARGWATHRPGTAPPA
jgi:hypothetical protein